MPKRTPSPNPEMVKREQNPGEAKKLADKKNPGNVSPIIRSARKRPAILLHNSIALETYNGLCDVLDALNAPHQNPDVLCLEESQLVRQRIKDAPTEKQRIIDSAFAAKANGVLKIPGVGVMRNPHTMNEVVNLMLAFSVKHVNEITLPDRSEFTRNHF